MRAVLTAPMLPSVQHVSSCAQSRITVVRAMMQQMQGFLLLLRAPAAAAADISQFSTLAEQQHVALAE